MTTYGTPQFQWTTIKLPHTIISVTDPQVQPMGMTNNLRVSPESACHVHVYDHRKCHMYPKSACHVCEYDHNKRHMSLRLKYCLIPMQYCCRHDGCRHDGTGKMGIGLEWGLGEATLD